jgi:uncharacterized protein YjbI with pentapeptide repeats
MVDELRRDDPRGNDVRGNDVRGNDVRGNDVRGNDVRRDDLRADCARCAGLCCVAPAFAKSTDFAVNKRPGTPCVNLAADFRCRVHDRLRPSGFPGCVAYDCFGAGQKIVQITYGGATWRDAPDRGAQMFAAYEVMRDLHELMYYLTEAASLSGAGGMRGELTAALDRVRDLTARPAADLVAIDAGEVRGEVNPLLNRASELQRRRFAGTGRDLRGASLIGASMRGADLRGASLRGAVALGADLRGADLTYADVTGADLRGADLSGANLTNALFLTQSQLEAAKGDERVRLSPSLRHPGHWIAR